VGWNPVSISSFFPYRINFTKTAAKLHNYLVKGVAASGFLLAWSAKNVILFLFLGRVPVECKAEFANRARTPKVKGGGGERGEPPGY